MASYSIYTLYPMINRTAAAHIHNHRVLLILRAPLSKSLRSLFKKRQHFVQKSTKGNQPVPMDFTDSTNQEWTSVNGNSRDG